MRFDRGRLESYTRALKIHVGMSLCSNMGHQVISVETIWSKALMNSAKIKQCWGVFDSLGLKIQLVGDGGISSPLERM